MGAGARLAVESRLSSATNHDSAPSGSNQSSSLPEDKDERAGDSDRFPLLLLLLLLFVLLLDGGRATPLSLLRLFVLLLGAGRAPLSLFVLLLGAGPAP